MKIGLIGLGKIGLNLALNMKDYNHKVVAHEMKIELCFNETLIISPFKRFVF